MNSPNWFNNHGLKMQIKELDLEKQILLIESNVAYLKICGHGVNGFVVEWEIKFAPPNYGIRGTIYMKKTDLASAFGLQDESGGLGQWLVDRHGADCAEQEKYIRQGIYLNIPGPGTGNDGDPNISVSIDDKIKNAIHQLLITKEPKYKCSKCHTEGIITIFQKDGFNFHCKKCGNKEYLFMRQELMDLDDPKDGELAMQIAGLCLK